MQGSSMCEIFMHISMSVPRGPVDIPRSVQILLPFGSFICGCYNGYQLASDNN